MRYSENYNMFLPDYGDPSLVDNINDNTEAIDELIHDNRTMIAPAFDTAQAYVIGDPVEYQGKLYVFTADKAAGAWDSSKVEQTTAAEIGGGGGASALADLDDVEITSPTDGQALLFDDSDDKWKNQTIPKVEANPSASATDDLKKLKVGNTVYAIPDPSVTAEATGNPIELTDAAAAPMVKCVTQITGSQDLHGYDKPWVGGAGKNKLPCSLTDSTSTKSEATVDSLGIVTVTGTSVNTSISNKYTYGHVVLPAGSYIVNGLTSGGPSTYFLDIVKDSASGTRIDYVTKSDKTITLTEETDVYIIIVIASQFPQTVGDTFTAKPMIRLSTVSDSTFEPYSNICPITGMDEVDVTVADAETDPTVENTYTIDLNGTRYGGTVDVVRGVMRVTHKIINFNGTSSGRKFELKGSSSENYYNFYLSVADGYNFGLKQAYVPTATARIYGMICSHSLYAGSSNNYGYWAYVGSARDLQLRLSFDVSEEIDTVAKANTWLANQYSNGTPLQMIYPLATPIEIPLTPMSLRTLLGNNYIWTDADSMDIKYITKPYEPVIKATDISIEEHGKKIESIITENLEPRMVASRNYTIGELIISGDKAYRATANIASGATLTVGTNVVETTIEEEIGRSGHVYSTSERVVGTWIDGSTLYEKSYHVSTVTSTYTTIDSNITCNNAKVRNSSMGTITVGGAYDNAQYVDGRISQTSFARVILKTGGLTVGMDNPPADPITDFDFTIQYTKSSS